LSLCGPPDSRPAGRETRGFPAAAQHDAEKPVEIRRESAGGALTGGKPGS
jgi:hypothetical protein